MQAWAPGRVLLLLLTVLVAITAVWLGRRDSSNTPAPAAATPSDAWYARHAAWLAANPAAVDAMRADLESARAAVSSSTTLQVTTAALQGSKLPKRVQVQQAQQLLIDKQLLSASLNTSGFAAARVAALRSHYQADQQPSRGILIVGGSRTHLGNAYILLRLLRQQLGCQLPVEVVYYGPQELDPAAARLVQDFAAAQAAAGDAPITLIDGLATHSRYLQPLLPHPDVRLTSWVAKVHALCWVTSFQQVLLLDSDNLPTQDPAALFHTPAFTNHGFLTWPDFWHSLWMEPVVYHLLNLTVPWETDPQGLAAESGQLLVDRSRHADVLEWLWLLNAHKGLVYKCLVGDKDTYRLAFQLAGKGSDYQQVPHPPRQLLLDTGPHKQCGRFIHLGMGQASPDGTALLFMHRTARGKFFPWCAASRQLRQAAATGGGCQPDWLTMPVVQEQLLASVPDPGSMRFEAGKLDTEWYKGACVDSTAPAGLGTELQDGDSSMGLPWLLRLPACSYMPGQLPIPVIPAGSVNGLQDLLEAVNVVFAEAAAVLGVPWVDRWKVFWGIL